MAPRDEPAEARFARYVRAIEGRSLPVALVDLDAMERNVETVIAPARARNKTVRIASKSLRSVDLIKRVAAKAGPAARGVMAYAAKEASFLVEQGMNDVLVAYPTADPTDAQLLARANKGGAVVRPVADAPEHLEVLAAAAREAGVRIPVVVDVDVAYRPLGAHIGVRRSPLHEASDVVRFVRRVVATEGLSFAGLLAYEAHIAGLADVPGPGSGAVDSAAKRGMKLVARSALASQREQIARALAAEGVAVALYNGGGTGSVAWTAAEEPITEVAAGSGFLTSHLFDRYRDIALEPAAFFALQIVREPAPGFVTCHGGGFIASGSAGVDRLPQPYLPSGLELTKLEGAGEVQTPLVLPRGVQLRIGSPVFFRHAKAGELAEHFNEYLLVRGDRIEATAKTYRGEGHAFL
jgi:D-serine deaminase-like pyridoxal phosphate-dependent protein